MRLRISRNSPLPLHEQLTGQIRLMIDSGELSSDDVLPTIKVAAEELGVNQNTVAAAYRELEQEGYLLGRKRAGTRVAPSPPAPAERAFVTLLAAEANRRARAAGVSPDELVRAVAAHGLAGATEAPIPIAVLADTAEESAVLAERGSTLLGDGVRCMPVGLGEYCVSMSPAIPAPLWSDVEGGYTGRADSIPAATYRWPLTLVSPRLIARLASPRESFPHRPSPPAYLHYGPDFPSAAD